MKPSVIANTIAHLKRCQAYRAQGFQNRMTNDPAWLVIMAINRRAGWPDDPTHSRGSCMPVDGKYPKKAEGSTYNHLVLLARKINTPRLIVRVSELGEWKKLLMARIPERFTLPEDE